MKKAKYALMALACVVLVGVTGWSLQQPPNPAPTPFTCPDGNPGSWVDLTTENQGPDTLYYTVCNTDNDETMEVRVEVDSATGQNYDVLPGNCIEVILAPGRRLRARDKAGDGSNNGNVPGNYKKN